MLERGPLPLACKCCRQAGHTDCYGEGHDCPTTGWLRCGFNEYPPPQAGGRRAAITSYNCMFGGCCTHPLPTRTSGRWRFDQGARTPLSLSTPTLSATGDAAPARASAPGAAEPLAYLNAFSKNSIRSCGSGCGASLPSPSEPPTTLPQPLTRQRHDHTADCQPLADEERSTGVGRGGKHTARRRSRHQRLTISPAKSCGKLFGARRPPLCSESISSPHLRSPLSLAGQTFCLANGKVRSCRCCRRSQQLTAALWSVQWRLPRPGASGRLWRW